ncbi:MAG: SGNH/GDSL hydrolase family protein, partial [Acidimicrobiia bacterium]|nr:SGNH/GDSL hydrolase family protein [Acidimicrobiia bacterium]
MRNRVAILLALSLLMGALSAAPALADHHGSGEDEIGDGGVYLALGDSVASGFRPGEPITDDGYANVLFDKLEKKYKLDTLINLSCPGDDTIEMISGVGGASPFGSACYGPFAQLPPGGPSQLDAAAAFLDANPGEVELITLTIGANDILACDPTEPDPDALNLCIVEQLGQIATNLPMILGTLQAAAGDVPIVAMNYYNPNLGFWVDGPDGQALAASSLGLTTAFNGTLEAIYDAFGVHVVDVETAFKTFETKGSKIPKNVKEICKLTLMCEKDHGEYVLSPNPLPTGPDIHPSEKGHKEIAKTFEELIKKSKVIEDDGGTYLALGDSVPAGFVPGALATDG